MIEHSEGTESMKRNADYLDARELQIKTFRNGLEVRGYILPIDQLSACPRFRHAMGLKMTALVQGETKSERAVARNS